MKCPYCGNILEDSTNFCPYCGKKQPGESGMISVPDDKKSGKRPGKKKADKKTEKNKGKKEKKKGQKGRHNWKLVFAVVDIVLILAIISFGIFYHVSRNHKYQSSLESGDTYISQQKYEKAAQAYSEALSVKKDSQEANLGMAKALAGQKNYEESASYAQKVIEDDHKNEEAVNLAIEAYENMDDIQSARDIAAQAVKDIGSEEIKKNYEYLDNSMNARKAYQEILEKYRAACNDDSDMEEEQFKAKYPDVYSSFMMSYHSYKVARFQYAYHDIDKNGIPELLVSAKEGVNGKRYIIGLYTFDGTNVHQEMRFVTVYEENEKDAQWIDYISEDGYFNYSLEEKYTFSMLDNNGIDIVGAKINIESMGKGYEYVKEDGTVAEFDLYEDAFLQFEKDHPAADIRWTDLDGLKESDQDLGQFAGAYAGEGYHLDINLDSVGDTFLMYYNISSETKSGDFSGCYFEVKDKTLTIYGGDYDGEYSEPGSQAYTLTSTLEQDGSLTVSAQPGKMNPDETDGEILAFINELSSHPVTLKPLGDDPVALLEHFYSLRVHADPADSEFVIHFAPDPYGADEDTVFQDMTGSIGTLGRFIADLDGDGAQEMVVTDCELRYEDTGNSFSDERLYIYLNIYKVIDGKVREVSEEEIGFGKNTYDTTHIQTAYRITDEGTFFYITDNEFGNKHEGGWQRPGVKVYQYKDGKVTQLLDATWESNRETYYETNGDYLSAAKDYLPDLMEAFYKLAGTDWQNNSAFQWEDESARKNNPFMNPLTDYEKDLTLISMLQMGIGKDGTLGDDYTWPGYWEYYIKTMPEQTASKDSASRVAQEEVALTPESDSELTPEDITFNMDSRKIGAKKKMKVQVELPEDVSPTKVVWESSDKKVITVKPGKDPTQAVLKAKKASDKKVKITVTLYLPGNKKISKAFYAKGTPAVKSVKIKGKSTIKKKAGKTVQLKAVVRADKGANKKIKWSSGNKKYATVNSEGKVSLKKAGKGHTVKITARSCDGKVIGRNKKSTVKIKIR